MKRAKRGQSDGAWQLVRDDPWTPEIDQGLRAHARNVKSQGGEDGILEHLFTQWWPPADKEGDAEGQRPRWIVEIGAWDGLHLSNSWNLLAHHGWAGLLVEGDHQRAAQCAANHRDRPAVQTACAYVSFPDDAAAVAAGVAVADAPDGQADAPGSPAGAEGGAAGAAPLPVSGGMVTLAALLARHGAPRDLEVLSIDVDGADYWLWRSLGGSAWRPRVVVVEFNPTVPNHVTFVQEASSAVHHGSSLAALAALGREMGYALVATTTYNGIFVDQAQLAGADGRRLLDLPPERLHVPSMTSDLFQLYDGTLVRSRLDLGRRGRGCWVRVSWTKSNGSLCRPVRAFSTCTFHRCWQVARSCCGCSGPSRTRSFR
jgi:hypothetical protein